MQESKYKTQELPEIRIGVGGNVDAGKSSFVGVMTKNILDNGRGYARSFIMKHKHELETGRTSFATQNYIQTPDKTFEFTDLAGHEKYLKTTISGIGGSLLNYVAIIINANVGIQHMTREHIALCYALKIPMFIVYTKIDMCPANIYKMNLDYITNFYLKKMNLETKLIDNENELHEFCKTYIHGKHNSAVPIFSISNVSGTGIETLKKFIDSLTIYTNYSELYNKDIDFCISRNYSVSGIGLVVSGVVKSGTIHKGDILYLGPNYDGFIRDKNNVIIGESNVNSQHSQQQQNNSYYKIMIKGIHGNFRNSVDYLRAGQSGCFNIKPVGKLVLKRNMLKKGMHILSVISSVRQFKAKIKVLHNPSTITVKYQPVIHCGGISQSVQIVEMDKEFLRSYDEAHVVLRFMFKPEFIETGSIFVFREGNTKGFGKILEIC